MECPCGKDEWIVQQVVRLHEAVKGFTYSDSRTEYLCVECGLKLGAKPKVVSKTTVTGKK